MECYRCKTLSFELKTLSSGKSYCPVCILKTYYNCQFCGEKFLLGDFETDYEESKKTAWKAVKEHEKTYHS